MAKFVKFLKISGICGMVTPVVALVSVFSAISVSPWFAWDANALSDLGAHAGSDIVFNVGLMAAAALAMVFSAGMFLSLSKSWTGRVVSVLLLADALALFGVGLFSEHAGEIHTWFSIAFFALFPIFCLALAGYFFVKKSLMFAAFSITAAFLAAVPWAFGWQAIAVPEFLSALVASTWVGVLGQKVYSGGFEE